MPHGQPYGYPSHKANVNLAFYAQDVAVLDALEAQHLGAKATAATQSDQEHAQQLSRLPCWTSHRDQHSTALLPRPQPLAPWQESNRQHGGAVQQQESKLQPWQLRPRSAGASGHRSVQPQPQQQQQAGQWGHQPPAAQDHAWPERAQQQHGSGPSAGPAWRLPHTGQHAGVAQEHWGGRTAAPAAGGSGQQPQQLWEEPHDEHAMQGFGAEGADGMDQQIMADLEADRHTHGRPGEGGAEATFAGMEAEQGMMCDGEEGADAAALAALDDGPRLVDCSTTNKGILLDRWDTPWLSVIVGQGTE